MLVKMPSRVGSTTKTVNGTRFLLLMVLVTVVMAVLGWEEKTMLK